MEVWTLLPQSLIDGIFASDAASSAGRQLLASIERRGGVAPGMSRSLQSAAAWRIAAVCLVAVWFWGALTTVIAAEPADAAAVFAIERSIQRVLEVGERSVVAIQRVRLPAEYRLERDVGREATPFNHPDATPLSWGMGVLVESPTDHRPLILTRYHVVRPLVGDRRAGETQLIARLTTQAAFQVNVFAADPRSDWAALEFAEDAQPAAGDYRTLPLVEPAPLAKGQFAVLLGNPYALARDGSPSVGFGVLSNRARRPLIETADTPPGRSDRLLSQLGTFWQLDSRVQLGASGGPAFNLQGQWIGMMSSTAAIEGYESPAGFLVAIDVHQRRMIDSVLRGHEVEFGFLGLGLRDVPVVGQGMRFQVEATEVCPLSPADTAGVQQHDLIVSIDGQPVQTRDDLQREVGLRAPGAIVPLVVRRLKQAAPLTLKVELGKFPINDEAGVVAPELRYPLWRGLRVDYPTARGALWSIEFRSIPPAVVVLDVVADSPAARAGIQRGDFIRSVQNQVTLSPRQFDQVTRPLKGVARVEMIDGRVIVVDDGPGQSDKTK